jgi:methylenetetrahydrofolate reductase (NADPH)
MIEEARTCTASDPAFAGVPAWRIGVAAGLRPLRRWKHAADKVAHDKMTGVEAACQQIARLRDSGTFDGVRYGAHGLAARQPSASDY